MYLQSQGIEVQHPAFSLYICIPSDTEHALFLDWREQAIEGLVGEEKRLMRWGICNTAKERSAS